MRSGKFCAIVTALVFAGFGTSFAQQHAAAEAPTLDMEPTCRGATMDDLDLADKPTFDTCMQEEQEARRELGRVWSTFPMGDRQSCTHETQIGGPPSYVDLLGCLQDAKFARELEKNKTL